MRASSALLLVSLMLLVAMTATAHHSFFGVYDGAQFITISGVVTQFKFMNPHALMFMDVTEASGKVEKWTVEFDGRLNLSEGGWTANSIKPKEQVTVTGNPARETAAFHQMFFRKLTKSDGTELVRYQDQRVKTVEEERRQRALERNQQK
jgi:Family of unknown function (DUF6152)